MFCFLKVTVPVSGMITIPAASLAGAQIVQTGANTNTTSSGQGTVTVTLPVAGNVVNSGGMVMVRKVFAGTGAFGGVLLSLSCTLVSLVKSLMLTFEFEANYILKAPAAVYVHRKPNSF